MPSLDSKLKKLRNILSKMDSAVIAFSGGVDSTFLLKVAVQELNEGAVGVIACSQTFPRQELKQARLLAGEMGAKIRVIKTDELKDINFLNNPLNRCYYCKKELFRKIRQIAKKQNINYVLDGSQIDDLKDSRFGTKAKQELGVRSPLQEAGFCKIDVRKASRMLGLNTWNKEAYACLASRIASNTKIETEALLRIERAEDYLRSRKFRNVRVRDHRGLARIEVAKQDISRLFQQRNSLVKKLIALGFSFVTIDIEGYRLSGLNKPQKDLR